MKKIVALGLALSMTFSISVYGESLGPFEEYSFSDFRYNSNGEIIDYYGTADFVSIPSTLDGNKITSVGNYSFVGETPTSIFVQEGIETIGTGAFEDTNIVDVDLPETLTYISEGAFANCKDLSYVWINSYNFEIAEGAFAGTGYVEFCIHCSIGEEEANKIIRKAKGDNNYNLVIYHKALVESMEEKDMWGENMVFCEICGFKGSKYLSNKSLPFTDVSNDTWYYPYVLTAYELGILNGKTKTSFDPNAGMTLAEAAKIAACIFESSAGTGADFTAKNGESWYQPYVDFCYEQYIIEDYITFDWEEPASRAEMAYLFSRADFDPNGPFYVNPDVPLTDIPDVDENTPFAYEILDLYRKGVAVGGQYMAFYPYSGVKRCEAAAFISRVFCYDMRVELPKG